MNKKGFTLIELTMVILILATIAIVTVPIVKTVITNAKNRSYTIMVDTIEEAGKTCFQINMSTYKADIDADGSAIIQVQYLKDQGYLKSSVENPLTEAEVNGYVEIRKTSTAKYEYEFFIQ